MTLVDDAAAVIGAAVPGWTVYKHGVPDAPTYPYVWVYSNAGVALSDDLADSRSLRDVTLWVTCTAAGERQTAALQVAIAAPKAQAALLAWRPTNGWRPVHLASQPPVRDEDLPDVTVMFAVDTYGITRSV